MKKCEKCGKICESEFCQDCGGKIIEVEEVKNKPMEQKVVKTGIVSKQLGDSNINDAVDNEKYVVIEDLANTVNENVPEVLKEGFKKNKKEKKVKKDKSNRKWFARKSFIIPTIFAVLFGFLWLGSPTTESISELETELSSLQTEYDEYKEEMEAFEGYTTEDLEQAKKEREKEEAEAQKELENEKKKGYNTGITYEQLARNPEKYEGKKIKFRGKVVQLIEGDGDEIQIRLAVNDDYDTILYCGYNKDIVSSRILEDDYITIYGVSTGTITYDSTMGGQITIPSAWVEKIDQ